MMLTPNGIITASQKSIHKKATPLLPRTPRLSTTPLGFGALSFEGIGLLWPALPDVSDKAVSSCFTPNCFYLAPVDRGPVLATSSLCSSLLTKAVHKPAWTLGKESTEPHLSMEGLPRICKETKTTPRTPDASLFCSWKSPWRPTLLLLFPRPLLAQRVGRVRGLLAMALKWGLRPLTSATQGLSWAGGRSSVLRSSPPTKRDGISG